MTASRQKENSARPDSGRMKVLRVRRDGTVWLAAVRRSPAARDLQTVLRSETFGDRRPAVRERAYLEVRTHPGWAAPTPSRDASALRRASSTRLLAFGVGSCGARRQPSSRRRQSCCPRLPGRHGRGQLHLRSSLGDTLARGAGPDVASVAAMCVKWVGRRFAGRSRCSPEESQLHRFLLRYVARSSRRVLADLSAR